jgi:hypothetical protein
MTYAVTFDYPEIMSEAAPLMLNKPLSEIISEMPDYLHIPWVCANAVVDMIIYILYQLDPLS